MYPIKRTLTTVVARLRELASRESQHDLGQYEAFAASYCVAEKLVRRVLVRQMELCGMKPEQIDEKMRGGYSAMCKLWPRYDANRELTDVIGEDAAKLLLESEAVRNKLLHGQGDPGVPKCKALTKQLIDLIPELAAKFKAAYGFNGWRSTPT